ncbi:MAG: hypothetical protein IGR76_01090 [Synechococcales cyanobacterium T60_A2020_003]|nr:hypothetical protein [Synechococcales cyanobacterium T60_A2020_003]
MLKHLILVCGASLAFVVALGERNEALKFTATAVGASCVSFAATSFLLERERTRKNQQAIAEAYLEFLRTLDQQRFTPKTPCRPVACQGCRHYHGRSYGGTMLICGMHPYGVEEETCGDWESGLSAVRGDR